MSRADLLTAYLERLRSAGRQRGALEVFDEFASSVRAILASGQPWDWQSVYPGLEEQAQIHSDLQSMRSEIARVILVEAVLAHERSRTSGEATRASDE